MLLSDICLSDVCLSCTYGLTGEQRPRKTKIGTEVAHVTRDPIGHQFQGQKVKSQLVADVLNSQHAGTGATWRINTKILSTCRGRRHIVAACLWMLWGTGVIGLTWRRGLATLPKVHPWSFSGRPPRGPPRGALLLCVAVVHCCEISFGKQVRGMWIFCLSCFTLSFLSRVSMPVHAERNIGLSVLSVRLSRAGTVSKWM